MDFHEKPRNPEKGYRHRMEKKERCETASYCPFGGEAAAECAGNCSPPFPWRSRPQRRLIALCPSSKKWISKLSMSSKKKARLVSTSPNATKRNGKKRRNRQSKSLL